MDIESLMDPRKAAVKPAANPRNYEAGIAQPTALRTQMLHGFRHGKAVGDTTHWKEWDTHFKWKKGELTIITGYNNSGKSEAVLQWMLTKSLHDGWKWAVFSPENEPVSEVFDALAHSLVGQSTDPAWTNCMSEARYVRTMEFLFQHFFVIDSDKLPEAPTPDVVFDYFRYLVGKHKIDGCFFDPWNQAYHDMGGNEVQYLSNELTKAKRFARKHNQCLVISAHPTKPQKEPGGKSWRCPDQFDISGGAMWGNKADNVLAVHRPNYLTDKSDTSVEWHAHKIKKQKLVGRPGFVSLHFEYRTNRFLLNGSNPIEPLAAMVFEPELAGQKPAGFPPSLDFPSSAINTKPPGF